MSVSSLQPELSPGPDALPLARIFGWVVDFDAEKLQPMDSGERRDAVLGWSIVGALVGALAVAALLGVFD